MVDALLGVFAGVIVAARILLADMVSGIAAACACYLQAFSVIAPFV